MTFESLFANCVKAVKFFKFPIWIEYNKCSLIYVKLSFVNNNVRCYYPNYYNGGDHHTSFMAVPYYENTCYVDDPLGDNRDLAKRLLEIIHLEDDNSFDVILDESYATLAEEELALDEAIQKSLKKAFVKPTTLHTLLKLSSDIVFRYGRFKVYVDNANNPAKNIRLEKDGNQCCELYIEDPDRNYSRYYVIYYGSSSTLKSLASDALKHLDCENKFILNNRSPRVWELKEVCKDRLEILHFLNRLTNHKT